MVVFWIFTVLVYAVTGVIILRWMTDIIETSIAGTVNDWWSIFIVLLWPVIMYVITLLTVFYAGWLLCKKVWQKIKSWFKKDKSVDTTVNSVDDTSNEDDFSETNSDANDIVADTSTDVAQ